MVEEELHAAEGVPVGSSKEVGDGFTIAAVQRARPAECSGRDVEADALDAWYMRAPLDLQCPITGDLYCEPVLTETGQVYERAALVRHLESHDTDPLTNTVLKSKTLTCVYPLKSRAESYRRRAAEACLSQVPHADCFAACALLRRAGALLPSLPGALPAEACRAARGDWPAARAALLLHASSLSEAGLAEPAARVLFAVFCEAGRVGASAAERRDLLLRCVRCWAGGLRGEAEGPEPGSSAEVGSRASAAMDLHTAQRVARGVVQLALLRQGEGRNAKDPVALPFFPALLVAAREAEVALSLQQSLCARLLGLGGSGSGPPDPSPTLPWAEERAVLLRFVEVLQEAGEEDRAALSQRLSALETLHAGEEPAAGGGHSVVASWADLRRLPRWTTRPAVTLALVALGLALPSHDALPARAVRLLATVVVLKGVRGVGC